jgi:hypothetical protein
MDGFTHTIVSAYKGAVELERKKLLEKIGEGHCKTVEDYKARCAKRAGLAEALEILDKTLRSYVDERDIDDDA